MHNAVQYLIELGDAQRAFGPVQPKPTPTADEKTLARWAALRRRGLAPLDKTWLNWAKSYAKKP
jgi:DNA-binding LacI/PurR family transcriptional regulator